MVFTSLDTPPIIPENLFKIETYTQEGLANLLVTAFTERRALLVREEQVSALKRALSIADSNPSSKVSMIKREGEEAYEYFRRVREGGQIKNQRRLLVARPQVGYVDLYAGGAVPILERPDRFTPETLKEVGSCLFEFAKGWCDVKFGPEPETGSDIVYAMVIPDNATIEGSN